MRTGFLWTVLGLCAWLLFPVQAGAQAPSTGARLFGKRCYSCHNIGGGDKKGPDLRGVTLRRSRDWLHEYIESPAAMNRRGDLEARALFQRFAPEVMPDQDLTLEQIDQVLTLIDEITRKNGTFVPAGAKLSRSVTPADAGAGLALFVGRARLASGGPPCISCHTVSGVGALGGGTLGPDLTGVGVKYSDPELISILQNPNFRTMNTVFGSNPLTDEEIVRLFAYLQKSGQSAAAAGGLAGPAPVEPWFAVIGFVALLAAIAAMSLIWKNRLRGIREELVRRSTA